MGGTGRVSLGAIGAPFLCNVDHAAQDQKFQTPATLRGEKAGPYFPFGQLGLRAPQAVPTQGAHQGQSKHGTRQTMTRFVD